MQCFPCNTLQHTATYCNILQHIVSHCNTLQHTATHCKTQESFSDKRTLLQQIDFHATHCNTLQHAATHQSPFSITEPFWVWVFFMMHIAHTATHCNTLQHNKIPFFDWRASFQQGMGWLWLVGSLKLQFSFAEYRLFHRALLQKRPTILWSLLHVATKYLPMQRNSTHFSRKWVNIKINWKSNAKEKAAKKKKGVFKKRCYNKTKKWCQENQPRFLSCIATRHKKRAWHTKNPKK